MTASSHLSNVWFSVTPLQVSHGQGCWVTTTTGEEYLDFAAGIAVNSTGHAHPAVAAAIGAQAQRYCRSRVARDDDDPWPKSLCQSPKQGRDTRSDLGL